MCEALSESQSQTEFGDAGGATHTAGARGKCGEGSPCAIHTFFGNTSCQLPVVSCQLPAASCQLTTVCLQRSGIVMGSAAFAEGLCLSSTCTHPIGADTNPHTHTPAHTHTSYDLAQRKSDSDRTSWTTNAFTVKQSITQTNKTQHYQSKSNRTAQHMHTHSNTKYAH